MKPTHKQMALKASLFMLLAANVSWHVPKTSAFKADFATSATELGTTGGAATRGAEQPLAVVKVEPPPAGTTPVITTAPVAAKSSDETQKICGVDFTIHFEQRSEAGKNMVYVDVKRVSPVATFPGLKMGGTYASRVEDAASKENLLDLVKANAIAKLKKEGKSCDEPVVVNPPPETTSPTAPPTRDDDKIARGLKNCTLDANGKPLRDYYDRDGMLHSDRFDCNLKRLEAISLDSSVGGEEEEIGGDRRTARRSRDRGARAGLAAVQDALAPLENMVRSLLTSSKDDRREDGEARLDDLINSLQVVADTATNSEDTRAMKRMIDTLQKAYPLGEKVDKLADAYSARFSAITDKMADLQSSMIGANQYQQYAIRMQMDQLGTARANLQQSLQYNQDIVRLQQYQQQGLLSQGDYTDFSADWFALLQGGSSVNGSGLAMAPQDLATGRSGFVDRGSGSWTPQAFPTNFNYGNIGLRNPSIAGGVNPQFPQTYGYPQTSGYPVTTGFPQTMPQSNLPMTLPANIQILNNGQAGYNTGYNPAMYQPQVQNGYYNPTVMSQPMRL